MFVMCLIYHSLVLPPPSWPKNKFIKVDIFASVQYS